MYVCICNAVTERQISQAYCEGACSLRALRERLGVAGCCGRCASCARDVLGRCKAEQAAEAASGNDFVPTPSTVDETPA
ncbi:bacterioferritin [Salinisphaera sp. USBA-960]|uniref:(2Fe-2S)-binding protein n=1 Tax=Salinisphaera orenii TaxID=856731 RepID=UPI000DBE7215|nr:bacterioferritin [Salifodinibacter halophilus]NNC25373.1 bacterioferritin [Salifodinibacter halophilus]